MLFPRCNSPLLLLALLLAVSSAFPAPSAQYFTPEGVYVPGPPAHIVQTAGHQAVFFQPQPSQQPQLTGQASVATAHDASLQREQLHQQEQDLRSGRHSAAAAAAAAFAGPQVSRQKTSFDVSYGR